MRELKNNELQSIKGGFLSAAMVNAVARGVNTVFTIGRSIGSSIRRIKENKVCAF